MQLPWLFRFTMTFLVLTYCANFPFLIIGMIWGFPAILLISLWTASLWQWHDSGIFIFLKTWFLGGFCIALVEILRQYHIVNEEGVNAYLSTLHYSIVFALIPLTVGSFGMALMHKALHAISFIMKKIERWIQKEMEIYHQTWIYRKYHAQMKKIRGRGWRIHNFLLKIRPLFKKKGSRD